MRLILLLAVLFAALPFIFACETRVIRQEEMFFMKHAEEHWDKLTPRQKAGYYEMIERQKARGREEKKKARGIR